MSDYRIDIRDGLVFRMKNSPIDVDSRLILTVSKINYSQMTQRETKPTKLWGPTIFEGSEGVGGLLREATPFITEVMRRDAAGEPMEGGILGERS